jgi:DNA-binding response OmpR family regulator
MIRPADKLRVLLVEDSLSTALPLIRFIEESGHQVVHVATGEAASSITSITAGR